MHEVAIYSATIEEVRSGLPLGRRLREFNYRYIGEYPESTSIWLNAKDDTGAVVGGLRGLVILNWLRIELLWVEETCRHQRVGTRLLVEAETQAEKLGASDAGLETFEWQAPDFYIKQGYIEASRVQNYVDSYYLAFMRKSLVQ